MAIYSGMPATAAERRVAFAKRLRSAIHKAFSPESIQASFRDCGLVPFNPDSVLADLPEMSPTGAGGTGPLKRTVYDEICGHFFGSSDDLSDVIQS